MESISGTSRTLGDQPGETMDISRWKEMPTCVPSDNVTLIPSLIESMDLKKSTENDLSRLNKHIKHIILTILQEPY